MKTRFLPALLMLCGVLRAQEPAPPATPADAARERLRLWVAEGSAAGLAKVWYDNRDAGHSRLDLTRYPQLRDWVYSEGQKAEKKDYGPPSQIHPAIVFGNASLSGPAVGGASIPRLFYGKREGIGFLTNQYFANHLYVFPEHQDHDAGLGDLYAVNSPLLLISQGSSGSDLPLLDAMLMTMASFPPGVQDFLERQKLLMPVLQQILRSSLKPLKSREDYLSGAAHPSVFPAEWIDLAAMMDRAHGMTVQTLPPMLQLMLVDESSPGRAGADLFEDPEFQYESLADRGAVIARVFRGMARERELRVRVTGIREWSGRPLQVHWRLLRGDPDLVTITRSETAPEATIRVRWHEGPTGAAAFPAPIASRRVEIGVFADDGVSYSPPCFVTFYFLPNERRRYDDRDRILEADYRFEGAFTDVTLTATKPWRDLYHYDKTSGTLTGWTREEDGKPPVEFDAAGHRLQDGKAIPVRYELDPETRRLRAVP